MTAPTPPPPPAGAGGEAPEWRLPVVAIVPALDRADTIAATVAALVGLEAVDEVVVVDDGSSDATASEAGAAGAVVVRLAANMGKGGAVAAGVGARPGAGTYLLVDADVGGSAAAVASLADAVVAGEADLAVGALGVTGPGAGFGLVRRFAAWGIHRATGLRPGSPLSGQRAVRGELLRSLYLAPRFGLEVAMTIDAAKAGARVVEIPVTMQHRPTGRGPRGFAHRGGQGLDAARALWPRLTTVRTRLAAIVVALTLAAGVVGWAGLRSEPSSVASGSRAHKVLVVGAPGLAWEDVGTGRLPALDGLIEVGALGAMNVRTGSDRPSSEEGYATLGAGSRVSAGPEASRATGRGPVVIVDPVAVREGAGDHLRSRPGELGAALAELGRPTGVVGTADTAPGLSGVGELAAVRRPAAVALMDADGRVSVGTVEADDLLVADPRAPFGRRADSTRVVEATVAALAAADVVLVDPGDLDRAAALAAVSAPDSFVANARAEALGRLDDLLGRLAAVVDRSTLILVVSVRPPGDEWRLVPVVAAGAGVVPGMLSSPPTRRAGLVTLADVGPTVIDALGDPVPSSLAGRPFRYRPGPVDRASLVRLDEEGAFRERTYVGIGLVFLVVQVALWALVGAAVVGGRRRGRRAAATRTLGLAALAVAAFPLATFVFSAARALPAARSLGLSLLVAVDAAVVGLAYRSRRRPLGPLAWILGTTVAVIVADVATGSGLQMASLLGYSPQTSGRLSGLGNTAFAVLAASAILAVALHVAHAPRRREAVWSAAGILVLVALVDGVPFLGDDVGGIATLVPVSVVFVVLGLGRAGRRLRWPALLGAAAATVAALAAAVAVDLARPPESRTHLGRLAADTWAGGVGDLRTTLARKLDANLSILAQAPAAWLVPAVALLLIGALVWRRRWTAQLPLGSPVRVGVIGALAAGMMGSLLNDSGVWVIALVLVEVGPVLALVAMGGADRGVIGVSPPVDGGRRTPRN